MTLVVVVMLVRAKYVLRKGLAAGFMVKNAGTRRQIIWLLFVIVVVSAVPLRAQDAPSAAASPVSTIRVDARSVVVDVVVTDRSGHAVSGLPRDRFQIFEDDKPQTITSFEEHSGLTPAVDAHASSTAPLPLDTFTNAPAALLTDSVNLLLMDSLNTPMGDQAYVRKQMVKYMASIPPGTRLGVFTLSERLRMIQGITTDTALLRQAIASSASNPSHSALLPSAEEDAVNRNAVSGIASAGRGSGQQEATAAALQQFLAQQAAFAADERVRYTLDAFNQLARYLAGVPGRKNLIWFSGSFPLCVFSDTECPYQEQVKETLDLLTRAQVAIYPIDSSGLAPDAMNDASAPPDHDLDSNLRHGASAGQAATVAQIGSLAAGSAERINNQNTMQALATGTGGQAVSNTNDLLGAFQRDIENGARYYTVAYTPPQHAGDGRSYSIKVQVNPGKYSLAYRRFYIDPVSNAAKAHDQATTEDPLRRLMVQGLPDFTQLRYRVHIVPVASPEPNAMRAGDNPSIDSPVTRYRLNFVLELDGVEFASDSGGNGSGSIEAAIVAYGRDGKPLNWETRALALSLTPQQLALAQHAGIPFQFDLDAPKGAASLRTGIFDTTSHRAGTIEIPLASVVSASEAVIKANAVKLPNPAEASLSMAGNPETGSGELPAHVAVTPPLAASNTVLAGSIPPAGRKASIAFWSLAPKEVSSMMLAAPDDTTARYMRLRSYFKQFGCAQPEMDEVPIGSGHEHSLVCTLPGTNSDQIVVTAHYERESGARATAATKARNWDGAILLAMLYKALQAEPRDHTFVFAALCGEPGEKDFLASLTRGHPGPAAAIALDAGGPGQLLYQRSWNGALVMLQDSTVGIAQERMDSLRTGEQFKAILASTLVKTARLSGSDAPSGQKAPAGTQNRQIVLRSSMIPSIFIYTDPDGRSPAMETPGPGSASNFEMLAAYLCALDKNLGISSSAGR